jgi:hypothetical protein
MSGGKGGKQSTSVTVPAWLEDAAKRNLARADGLAQIGYAPYYGPDVAAMTPAQAMAMQNTGNASQAFGLGSYDPMAGMPQAQSFGGVQGYSSGPMYDQALAALKAKAPGQFDAMMAPFINPQTGAQPMSPYGTGVAPGQPVQGGGGMDAMQGGAGGGPAEWGGMMGQPSTGGGLPGGYTSFNDMFNGGGPGGTGTSFSGGIMSGALNSLGVDPVASGGGSAGMGGGKK